MFTFFTRRLLFLKDENAYKNNTNPSKPTKPNNKFESKDISRLEVNEGRLKKNN